MNKIDHKFFVMLFVFFVWMIIDVKVFGTMWGIVTFTGQLVAGAIIVYRLTTRT